MTTELLFSYGTLQDPKVQLKTFGRLLKGYSDQLLDYRLSQLSIENNAVVELSGKAYHPIAVPSQGNQVEGKVFKITPAELAQSDLYEVSAYQRVIGKFQSGQIAWAYVQAKQ